MPIGCLVLEDTPDKLVHLKTQLTHNLIRGVAWIQSNVSVESLECERTPNRQEMELETTTTSVWVVCVWRGCVGMFFKVFFIQDIID